jgi:hypothetical protein
LTETPNQMSDFEKLQFGPDSEENATYALPVAKVSYISKTDKDHLIEKSEDNLIST